MNATVQGGYARIRMTMRFPMAAAHDRKVEATS